MAAYTHAACVQCGRRWAIDRDAQPIAGHARNTPPDPLDGEWYAGLTYDELMPVASCPAPCGALVYLQPSQWIARETVVQAFADKAPINREGRVQWLALREAIL